MDEILSVQSVQQAADSVQSFQPVIDSVQPVSDSLHPVQLVFDSVQPIYQEQLAADSVQPVQPVTVSVCPLQQVADSVQPFQVVADSIQSVQPVAGVTGLDRAVSIVVVGDKLKVNIYKFITLDFLPNQYLLAILICIESNYDKAIKQINVLLINNKKSLV